MYCTKCGEKIDDNSIFCTECGNNTSVDQNKKFDIDKKIEVTVRNNNGVIKPRHSFQNSACSKIVIYVVIFLVLNVLLWGGQELWHYKDNRKLSELKTQMQQIDQMNRSFENDMNANGATQSKYDQYSARIDERNKLADEYNVLSKSSGSRWYIIPIPIPSHK